MIYLTVITMDEDGRPETAHGGECTVTEAFYALKDSTVPHWDHPREVMPLAFSWTSEDPHQEHRLTRLIATIWGVPARSPDEWDAMHRDGDEAMADSAPADSYDHVYPPQ